MPRKTRRKATRPAPEPDNRVALLEAAVIGLQEQVRKIAFDLAAARATIAEISTAYVAVKSALADAQRNERLRERAHRTEEQLAQAGII